MDTLRKADSDQPDLEAWKRRVHAFDNSMHELREHAGEPPHHERQQRPVKSQLAKAVLRHRLPHPHF